MGSIHAHGSTYCNSKLSFALMLVDKKMAGVLHLYKCMHSYVMLACL